MEPRRSERVQERNARGDAQVEEAVRRSLVDADGREGKHVDAPAAVEPPVAAHVAPPQQGLLAGLQIQAPAVHVQGQIQAPVAHVQGQIQAPAAHQAPVAHVQGQPPQRDRLQEVLDAVHDLRSRVSRMEVKDGAAALGLGSQQHRGEEQSEWSAALASVPNPQTARSERKDSVLQDVRLSHSRPVVASLADRKEHVRTSAAASRPSGSAAMLARAMEDMDLVDEGDEEETSNVTRLLDDLVSVRQGRVPIQDQKLAEEIMKRIRSMGFASFEDHARRHKSDWNTAARAEEALCIAQGIDKILLDFGHENAAAEHFTRAYFGLWHARTHQSRLASRVLRQDDGDDLLPRQHMVRLNKLMAAESILEQKVLNAMARRPGKPQRTEGRDEREATDDDNPYNSSHPRRRGWGRGRGGRAASPNKNTQQRPLAKHQNASESGASQATPGARASQLPVPSSLSADKVSGQSS